MRPGQSSSQPPGPFPELAGRTILQIIPELDAGGAERTTIDVAAALVASGARALVRLRGRPSRQRIAGARRPLDSVPGEDEEPAEDGVQRRGGLQKLLRDERVRSRACALARSGLGGAGRRPPPETSAS